MTLPWPPSVNSYWRHPTRGALAGRHLISEQGRKYRQEITAHALIHRSAKLLSGRLAIEINAAPPDRRVRDLDNILKSLLDSLVHAGVIKDDGLFDEIILRRLPPQKPGSVSISIKTIEIKI